MTSRARRRAAGRRALVPRRPDLPGRPHRGGCHRILQNSRGSVVAELWLDYDLGTGPDGRTRTARPVVDELVRAARAQQPYPIGVIRVHTANPTAAVWMLRELRSAGYAVERTYDLRVFVNRQTEQPP